MKTIFIIVFTFSLSFVSNLESISQTYIGIYSGVAQGIDESSQRGNQGFERIIGGSIVYNLKNKSRIASELSIFYTSIGTNGYSGDNDYHTSIITGDLRVRYFFNRDLLMSPYIGAGLGISFFQNNIRPLNLANPFQQSFGAFVSAPIFVGMIYPISKSVDFDIQVGPILTNTDLLNPIINDTYDHWFYARVGLYFNVSK